MTTLLPVHMLSQPVKCQSSFWWTIGCVRRWKSLTSPSQRATLQETQKLLASSKINSSSLPSRPDGMGCMPMFLVGHRKASPQWHLENNWRIPESLGKVIPIPRSLHPHLRWSLEESNVLPGQPLHPLKHALQILTDASKEGLGTHLNTLQREPGPFQKASCT